MLGTETPLKADMYVLTNKPCGKTSILVLVFQKFAAKMLQSQDLLFVISGFGS
jgi:hypothetical protein